MRIGDLLRETTALCLSGTSVRYELVLPEDLSPLIVDETQINSALRNIITNARESMPWGGTLVIEASNIEISGPNGDAVDPGNYIKIDIRDSGTGIDPRHLEKIFDPYFTTKQMGAKKGMGLGLAICHSIIKKHHGHITVQSEVGQGTAVTLLLPASATRIEAAPQVLDQSGAAQRYSRKLLFMDDEKIIWDVVASAIKQIQCGVDFAINGNQALSLYRRSLEKGEAYAAVILDLTIRGGVGGKEVIRDIHLMNPDAKAIVLSGYSTDPVFADYQRYGFMGAIKKPFKIDEFINLVSGIIDASVG
jgi:CheY-like chemotaxis protein/anti-sigma regulatory factor (Ser/Thr protein kinase)